MLSMPLNGDVTIITIFQTCNTSSQALPPSSLSQAPWPKTTGWQWYTPADLDTLITPDPPATIWTWKVEQFTILIVNYWHKHKPQICPVLRQACFFQLCQLITSTYQSCLSYKPVRCSGYISRFCFVLQACSSHFLTLPGHLCQNIIFCRSMVGPLIIASQKSRYSSLFWLPPCKTLYWQAIVKTSHARLAQHGFKDDLCADRWPSANKGRAGVPQPQEGRAAPSQRRPSLKHVYTRSCVGLGPFFLPPWVAVKEAPAHSSDAHWVTGAGPPLRGAQLSLASTCQWGEKRQRDLGAEPRNSRVNRGSSHTSGRGGGGHPPPLLPASRRCLPRHRETREGFPCTACFPPWEPL